MRVDKGAAEDRSRGGRMMGARALALVSVVAGLMVGATSIPPPAAANAIAIETASPTPCADCGYPVRYVLSGPASSMMGGEASFRVDYEGVRDPAYPGLTFTLTWTQGAASFVSLDTLTGPRGKAVELVENHVDVLFPNQAGPGAVVVNLLLSPSFTGTLETEISVRGSSITMPDGSVLTAYTTVTPQGGQSGLPGTGTGAESHSQVGRPEILIGMGLIIVASAWGGWLVRKRRARQQR